LIVRADWRILSAESGNRARPNHSPDLIHVTNQSKRSPVENCRRLNGQEVGTAGLATDGADCSENILRPIGFLFNTNPQLVVKLKVMS